MVSLVCMIWIMVVLPTHMNIVVEVSLHLDPRPFGCSMDMRLSRLWIASGTNHIAHLMQICLCFNAQLE